jgi:hypothetical protein
MGQKLGANSWDYNNYPNFYNFFNKRNQTSQLGSQFVTNIDGNYETYICSVASQHF